MSLFTLGINHKTAPVAIREKVSFGPESLQRALHELKHQGIAEAAILSTCNRTELYCNLDDDQQVADLITWLAQYHQLPSADLEPYLYRHQDNESVRHTLRVASGLDSLVLGEPQILGQLKDAFQQAKDQQSVGKNLSRLFQHAFSTAKRVRTDTEIGSSPVSVAFAAVSLAKQIFGELEQQTALMIGAGETIELAARHLKTQGIGHIIIANRSVERAKNLAAEFNAEAISLSDIGERLTDADIVVSSTAAPVPILGKGTTERALKKRRHQPIFMVDIAVPRDIEPEVGDLDDVYLYTVDDLEEVIEANRQSRQEAAEQAEEIIEQQVHDFMAWLKAQETNQLIRDYRENAFQQRDDVLKKALKLHNQGKSAEETLQFLAFTLTNKLIHQPTQVLNQAARDDNQRLLQAACDVLGLENEQS